MEKHSITNDENDNTSKVDEQGNRLHFMYTEDLPDFVRDGLEKGMGISVNSNLPVILDETAGKLYILTDFEPVDGLRKERIDIPIECTFKLSNHNEKTVEKMAQKLIENLKHSEV